MPIPVLNGRLAAFSSLTTERVQLGGSHALVVAISGVLVLIFGVLLCGLIVEAVTSLCHLVLSALHNPKHSGITAMRTPSLPTTRADTAVRAVLRRHVDIDALCPITAHTPVELPPRRPGRPVLPDQPGSPCALCSGFCSTELIKHGHLKRTLPCSHEFHAICVDKYFMAESESGSCVHDFYCPTCSAPVLASAKDGVEKHRPVDCSTFLV
jgi:hypothetical protein